MADDKKKLAPAFSVDLRKEVTFLLIGIFLLTIVINRFIAYLYANGWNDWPALWNYFIYSRFISFWSVWKVISVILSAVAVVWAYYSVRKLSEVAKEEEKVFGPLNKEDAFLDEITPQVTPKKLADKWERVVGLSYSTNQADWRLAIMEADIMLEEALRTKGFVGDGVGEMLKGVQSGDLISLDSAWDAHKVRNKIAHSGEDFELNERETRRVIDLFESALKELDAI